MKSNAAEELEAFLAFLQTIWGLLAGVSVFFPLSNVLVHAIPLEPYGDTGVYDKVPPALISTLATVVTLFVVLVSFAGRARFRIDADRQMSIRAAWVSLGVSLICLAAYLVMHQTYAEYAYARWDWGSGDPRKLLMEIPLAALYVACFTLLTRAFVLLAMIEFYGSVRRGDGS